MKIKNSVAAEHGKIINWFNIFSNQFKVRVLLNGRPKIKTKIYYHIATTPTKKKQKV